ncbi:MAG: hypothetical protein HOI03_06405, partial [Candidatus Marinimicrobia bacterium]|nr:hypothetical protein [Candidatus Neomarinimicrobiota bacterium]
MLIFKRYQYLILAAVMIFSCEEAVYTLDNPLDPTNMDLAPPALFFHPPEINVKLDTVVAVELYGLELEPS